MSRFFRVSDSDSDSESDVEKTTLARNQQANQPYSFSDEEDEVRRVVRSAKEKRYKELHAFIKQIKNCRKNKDLSKILTAFESLTRAFIKARPVIEKEEGGITPKFYIKCLFELETFINEIWEDKEGRKKLSKINSRSLGTLRQKVKKYNRDFEQDIIAFKEFPEVHDDEFKSSDSEDEDESESKPIPADQQFTKDESDEEISKEKVARDDDESESDDEWPSSSDESSLSSDDDKYGANLAAKFLKVKPDTEPEAKLGEKRIRRPDKEKKASKKKEEDEDDDGWEKVKGGTAPGEKPSMFAEDEEINHQSVLKKILEISAMRGKKRMHRSEQMRKLNELLNISEQHNLGQGIEVKTLLTQIATLFDYNPNVSICIKPDSFLRCIKLCDRLLNVMTNNPEMVVSENINEETETFEAPYRVYGCALTLIEKLDEEFTKILQSVDPHSPDYIVRLRNEQMICNIIERLQTYLESVQRGSDSDLCRIYILRIDHVYFKFDPEVVKKRAIVGTKKNEIDENESDEVKEWRAKETSLELMDRLCKFIYVKDQTDRIRTQAILCQIYHHSLHDNWFEARDLMLMSQLQHNINKADIPLMVIYNRAIVQLGLCAFREGKIRDAHSGLLDIQMFGRVRELLAQGLLQKPQERTPEQERQEKRRLLPFHKHINLDLIECVYLVSAMLLEIPDVAANEFSGRKKISRAFYTQLRKNEEQPFVGLPETVKENVVAASKAMRVGNWKTCRDFIINDKMNSKVWNLFNDPDKVRSMLVEKIKEESMRSYLFTYSYVYDCISLTVLSEMFELDSTTVHSIISKMIIGEELMASLDEPTQTIIMHRTEPSRIQGLALQLGDKLNNLLDQNERTWDWVKQIGTGQQNQRTGYQNRRNVYNRNQNNQINIERNDRN